MTYSYVFKSPFFELVDNHSFVLTRKNRLHSHKIKLVSAIYSYVSMTGLDLNRFKTTRKTGLGEVFP